MNNKRIDRSIENATGDLLYDYLYSGKIIIDYIIWRYVARGTWHVIDRTFDNIRQALYSYMNEWEDLK